MTRARTRRRWWLAPLVVVLGLVGTGCDTGIDGIDDGGSGPATKPVTLIVSETWVNDHQGDPGTGGAAGGSDVQARLTTLQKAIDRLRDETGTGWVGPAGRRHRLPLRAQRRVVAGHPDGVHGRHTDRTCSASTPPCSGSASRTP